MIDDISSVVLFKYRELKMYLSCIGLNALTSGCTYAQKFLYFSLIIPELKLLVLQNYLLYSFPSSNPWTNSSIFIGTWSRESTSDHALPPRVSEHSPIEHVCMLS